MQCFLPRFGGSLGAVSGGALPSVSFLVCSDGTLIRCTFTVASRYVFGKVTSRDGFELFLILAAMFNTGPLENKGPAHIKIVDNGLFHYC